MTETADVRAGILLIGDELLSGRTQDANLSWMSTYLNRLGVRVTEAHVIGDEIDVIATTLNDMRARLDYVFTTGGIGPTHDDITADAVARAFGVGISHHEEAVRRLESHYKKIDHRINEARLRMARIPDGGQLIDNAISTAPGFQLENVFVLAGVPMVMQVMMDALAPRLKGGAVMLSRTIVVSAAEGELAQALGAVQAQHPGVSMGSYPFYHGGSFGVRLVLRGPDADSLKQAGEALLVVLDDLGVEIVAEGASEVGE